MLQVTENTTEILTIYESCYTRFKPCDVNTNFDLDNLGAREKLKGDMREGFLMHLLMNFVPNYHYQMTTEDVDKLYGVDIIVSNESGPICGIDVKGAGFERSLERDETLRDRHNRRMERQQTFGIPVLTFDLDLNPYGLSYLLKVITTPTGEEHEDYNAFIAKIIRQNLLRNNINKNNTTQLAENYLKLENLLWRSEDFEVCEFIENVRNAVIPERIYRRKVG